MSAPVCLPVEACAKTDPAKLFAIADADGSRRVSEACLATSADVFLVLVAMLVNPHLKLEKGQHPDEEARNRSPVIDAKVICLAQCSFIWTLTRLLPSGFWWCGWVRFGRHNFHVLIRSLTFCSALFRGSSFGNKIPHIVANTLPEPTIMRCLGYCKAMGQEQLVDKLWANCGLNRAIGGKAACLLGCTVRRC